MCLCLLAASPLLVVASSGAGGGKVRGASDQPGVCPLCGSMLRQARNLRRHLLTSCRYRMMGDATQPTSSSPSDSCLVPLQPLSFVSSPIFLHSSGNATCEQIVCKVSPLPSPLPSPVSSCGNVISPSCRTVTSPPLLPPPPPPPLPLPPPPPQQQQPPVAHQ